jgi:hypothetical protein
MLTYSCSTINLKSRKGIDEFLNASTFNKLSGDFVNSKHDSIKNQRTLYYNFNYDTIYKKKDLVINIKPIDKRNIEIKVIDKEIIIDSLTLKGKFKNGYFKTKRKWNSDFFFGPILWLLGDNYKYLGLTKDNNLVIIDSGNGGMILLVFFPLIGGGSGQSENEYQRKK